MDSKKYRIIV